MPGKTNNSIIHICNWSSETDREAKAKDFRNKIGNYTYNIISVREHFVTERFATNECVEMGMIATCQYIFPLCNIKTGQSYTFSQEACLKIQEECKLEYHIVKLLHLAVLPDCSSLPKANSTSMLK